MKQSGLILLGAMILSISSAAAQDATPIIFGIYYRCNQTQEAQADEVVQNTLGPLAQTHVDAGHLTGWAWFTHAQGGAWRRIFVTTGTDMSVMMNVRSQMVAAMANQHADAANTLSTACGGHDDYIWTGVSNSTPDPDLIGPATLSAYHSCDRSREARADEIFEEVLAPLYQKHMDMGHIASWGFWAHRVGGSFRRLETMSGPDHMALMNMQDAIYGEATETRPLAMQEFNQICSAHSDYMWNNANQQ